jgi:hypothetical protein
MIDEFSLHFSGVFQTQYGIWSAAWTRSPQCRHCFGGHVAFGGLGLPIGITLAASEAKLGPLVQLVSKQNS